MPFVGTDRARRLYKKEIQPEAVGDLCAIAFTPLIRAWRENPRWTTVHTVIKPMLDNVKEDLRLRIQELHHMGTGRKFLEHRDARYATDLAYEVFFCMYVMPYERKKFIENGGVE